MSVLEVIVPAQAFAFPGGSRDGRVVMARSGAVGAVNLNGLNGPLSAAVENRPNYSHKNDKGQPFHMEKASGHEGMFQC